MSLTTSKINFPPFLQVSDSKYFGGKILENTALGAGLRIKELYHRTKDEFFPNKTEASLAKSGYEHLTFENTRTSPKLKYLLERIEAWKQKLKIKEIKLFTHASDIQTGSLRSKHSWGTPVLLLGPDVLKLSNEAIDFVIGHEMHHIAQDHSLKKFAFCLTVALVDCIFLLCPPLIFPVEGLAFIGKTILSQHFEKQADHAALVAQKTNRGAIAYFKASLQENLELKKQHPHLVTEEGDNRQEIFHPPLTARLQTAKLFY